MSTESQLPNSDEKELTPEQLAEVSGGLNDNSTVPIDTRDIVVHPASGSQTSGDDDPDQLKIRIPL
ncbi:MAG: hypothetical protein Kow00121_07460 [Elainellaceae cyanobacterium]